jgi:hypothetical protein
VILGATLLGAPVSTTQVVASSVVGAGTGRRRWHHVRWAVVRDMGVACRALGRGDQPPRARDGVRDDRDRVDAGAYEQLGVLRVHRRRLAAGRRPQAELAGAWDQRTEVVGDRLVALVEGAGSISESRSRPSMSWVRSLDPIEIPAMPIRA